MPVKNEEAYLKITIESILNQKYNHWELLAVDDHSIDSSWEILCAYRDKDSRIKIFRNEDSGIIPALKLAYTHASGAYLSRMDADDIMPPIKLNTLLDLLLSSTTPAIATGKVKYFSEDGIRDGYARYELWLNELCDQKKHYTQIYKECVIPSPCWMTDRRTFDIVGGFEPDRYPEDYDLTFRFYQHGIPVIASHKIVHHWRDYPTRTSRTSSHYSDNRFLEIKTEYFIKIDYRKEKKLLLWGAGKKAKRIAKLLISGKTPFLWISNNPKKIGKSIYDQLIKADKNLPDIDAHFILAIANPKEKKEAIQRLKSVGHHVGKSIFPFC